MTRMKVKFPIIQCLQLEMMESLQRQRLYQNMGGARPSLSQSENLADSRVDDADESMASEEDDAGPAKAKTASGQNERLYTEEGMLKTELKNAEKRRKKNNKSSAMKDDINDDYDFKVYYVSKGSAMVGEGVGRDADKNKNRFELPTGIDLENERDQFCLIIFYSLSLHSQWSNDCLLSDAICA